MTKTCLLLACGALAPELVHIARLNGWQHLQVQCLPPELHNRPAEIPAAVRTKLEEYRGDFDRIFVAYGDCGTAGELDKVLSQFGVERLPGAHCYEFYSGDGKFAAYADAEPATYYLTDFLVRHFDRIVRKGLGLEDRPELLPVYFGNYRRLLYLAQRDDPELRKQAESHARFLGLEFDWKLTGLGHVERELEQKLIRHDRCAAEN